jgi:lysophospholipase L1-like esterase
LRRAALGALAVLAAGPACSGTRVERSEALVCGQHLDVTVRGDDTEIAGAPGDWRLTFQPDDGDGLRSLTGPLPLRTDDAEDGWAFATAPDLSCTAWVGVGAGARRRVVGDSLTFQVDTMGDPGDGLAWQGTPGAGWAAVTDDPANSAIDEIRGAVAEGLDLLVLQFGANDALFSANRLSRRAVVQQAIDAGLDAAAGVPCIAVVTPSAAPTVIFDLGDAYRVEAEAVAQMTRDAVAARPGLLLADWTAASADHHLPDGTDGDWFLDGDEIHPNEAGRAALVDLVEETVAQCP